MAMEHETPPAAAGGPIIYTDSGFFPEGRILAADFHSGSVDFYGWPGSDTIVLTDEHINDYALLALGFEQQYIADQTGYTRRQVQKRYAAIAEMLGAESGNAADSINAAFDDGLIRIARPLADPALSDPLLQAVWDGVADGMTNARIARRLPLDESAVKDRTGDLYRKLGVANRAAATLLRRMVADTSTGFVRDPIDTDRIVSFRHRGGILHCHTEPTLTAEENNAFLLRACLFTVPEAAGFLYDRRSSTLQTQVSHASAQAVEKYGTDDITEAVRLAAAAGQLTVERASIPPSAPLTGRQRQMWDLLAAGTDKATLARRFGISTGTVTSDTTAILRATGSQNMAHATVRHYMTYPSGPVLPPDHTYDLRLTGGIQLPDPRALKHGRPA